MLQPHLDPASGSRLHLLFLVTPTYLPDLLPPIILTSPLVPEPPPLLLEDESSQFYFLTHPDSATKLRFILPPAMPSQALNLQGSKVPTIMENTDI